MIISKYISIETARKSALKNTLPYNRFLTICLLEQIDVIEWKVKSRD